MNRSLLGLAFLLLTWISPTASFGHPMDAAKLNLTVVEDRLVGELRLHRLAAERFVPQVTPVANADYSTRLFTATLGQSVPKLNALACVYLRPEVSVAPDDPEYLTLKIVMTCRWTMNRAIHLDWELPFLANASDAFQLMATLETSDHGVTLIANRKQPRLEFGENSRTFLGFVKMGMGHIGARFDEWDDRQGHLQLPEGIDHILFVIALVLAGGSLWSLVKTATGFTVGHSITLALTVYKVVHIHSKWIEVGIAFSIAYVAGLAFWRKGSRAENWWVAGLFGVVHGLGFSGALQDLELSPNEVLTALAGFNIGVELGQCLFILLSLGILAGLQRISSHLEANVRRVAALAVCLTGFYWLISRAIV